jgi:HEPN domain-containing protein
MVREEIENWWLQALKDLEAAQDSITSKHFEWACFQAHQAVEKALKALILQEKRRLVHTHELLRLGEFAGVPVDLTRSLAELNMEYVTTRYPNAANTVPHKLYYREKAVEKVAHAEKVIAWTKKRLRL